MRRTEWGQCKRLVFIIVASAGAAINKGLSPFPDYELLISWIYNTREKTHSWLLLGIWCLTCGTATAKMRWQHQKADGMQQVKTTQRCVSLINMEQLPVKSVGSGWVPRAGWCNDALLHCCCARVLTSLLHTCTVLAPGTSPFWAIRGHGQAGGPIFLHLLHTSWKSCPLPSRRTLLCRRKGNAQLSYWLKELGYLGQNGNATPQTYTRMCARLHAHMCTYTQTQESSL